MEEKIQEKKNNKIMQTAPVRMPSQLPISNSTQQMYDAYSRSNMSQPWSSQVGRSYSEEPHLTDSKKINLRDVRSFSSHRGVSHSAGELPATM